LPGLILWLLMKTIGSDMRASYPGYFAARAITALPYAITSLTF
jgi:hypothetical protein